MKIELDHEELKSILAHMETNRDGIARTITSMVAPLLLRTGLSPFPVADPEPEPEQKAPAQTG